MTDPSFALPGTGKLLFAVAATQNAANELRNVYGLFMGGDIASAEWQLIATLPLQGGDAISSVASLTGHQVFAGTRQGRIFSLVPFQDPFELTVSPADKGTVFTTSRSSARTMRSRSPFTTAPRPRRSCNRTSSAGIRSAATATWHGG